ICLKGLRKETRQRYGSALELANDLRRFLDGKPIQARPVSSWERAWKWARREPTKAAAIGAVLFALVASAAGMLFFGLYKQQQATALTDKLERQKGVRHKLDQQRRAAEEAETANRFADAKQHWNQALVLLDGDPDAFDDELPLRLQEGLARAQRNWEEQETVL